MGDGAQYVLVWDKESEESVRQTAENLLVAHGLDVEWSKSKAGHLATVHGPFDALAAEVW